VLQPLVDQVVASTLEKSGKTGDRSNEVRAQQLRLRGFEMADVADYGLLQQKKTELREAIAAAGQPIKASQGKKYTPDELKAILEARLEAMAIAGARDLGSRIRATDELNGLRKVLATGNEVYIADQCDRIMATTGLLYG